MINRFVVKKHFNSDSFNIDGLPVTYGAPDRVKQSIYRNNAFNNESISYIYACSWIILEILILFAPWFLIVIAV